MDLEKNSSTVYALVQITELTIASIDRGKFGCGIFIDLRKAFDTVNHKILLTKLEHYGVGGNMLHWFQSYLSNRKQYVSMENFLNHLELIVVYPKDQSLVHYSFYYTLMIYQILVKC